MGIEIIEKISHNYGKNINYVIAGGGNTSFKDSKYLYIKGSGTSLATVSKDGFVKMDREKLNKIFTEKYSEDKEKRESEVLSDMMNSRCDGEQGKRPSVETLLHNLFSQKYVLHLHPSMINGVTCSQNGKKIIQNILPMSIWVEETEPGYVLSSVCKKKMDLFLKENKKEANLLFLQNHGVFFAGNSDKEIDLLFNEVMNKISGLCIITPDFSPSEPDLEKVKKVSPVLRLLYDKDGYSTVRFTVNKEIKRLCSSLTEFGTVSRPFSPDHIVYCKAKQLFCESANIETIKEKFKQFEKENGYKPKIVFVKDLGMFALGETTKETDIETKIWLDAIKISVYSKNFGGPRYMAREMVNFISNWEVERYRSKVAINTERQRFANKIVLITGSAQGLGKDLSTFFAKDGALVVIADINYKKAFETAQEINKITGKESAISIKTDVTNADTIKNAIEYTVSKFGGLDVLICNAGVLLSGKIEDFDISSLEKVTEVNYYGYFNSVKEAIPIMKIQNEINKSSLCDIIEINSKSGLIGSKMNFAYSGSKFGGIGLTQSFALELAPYGVKVNAVCPGNLLDGELWNDKKNGLFVQYLKSGKVEGAKTVEDIRKYYESKVPLGRACKSVDVYRAVSYVIEQEYETGQSIPVTGGQIMIN